MEDQLILFETAKYARKANYPSSRVTGYRVDGTLVIKSKVKNLRLLSRPTQSLLQKWLRDNHKIHINVFPVFEFKVQGWSYKMASIFVNPKDKLLPLLQDKGYFDTYEEALEAGLVEALKLI